MLNVSQAKASATYYPTIPWNGYKIYLSPSSQTGNNGCNGYNEASRMLSVAQSAAQQLQGRGYRVRVGTGTVAQRISDSNAFAPNFHIALHSNARPETCSNSTLSDHGTVIMYASTAGRSISSSLVYTLGELGIGSPGSDDIIATDTSYVGGPLPELRNTNAVTSYVEAEFHTWSRGVAWLNSSDFPWLIGYGIDFYLGYPR